MGKPKAEDLEPRVIGLLCGAKTRHTDEPCKQPAGFRTDHQGYGRCWLHGGNAPSHRKAAMKERVARLSAASVLRDVAPEQLMNSSLAWTAGHLEWLNKLASRIEQVDSPETYALLKLIGEERDRAAAMSKQAMEVDLPGRERAQQQLNADYLTEVIERVARKLRWDLAPVGDAVRAVVSELEAGQQSTANGRGARQAPPDIEGRATEPSYGDIWTRRREEADALGLLPKNDRERPREWELLRALGFHDTETEQWDTFVREERKRRGGITSIAEDHSRQKQDKPKKHYASKRERQRELMKEHIDG